ncbi:hypothetical protein HYU20_02390 [Candidatus Woesearchaeota archaeon]|nr:hypothetical protein [Candidatus Woesearchaeota archaeon]
MATNPDSMENFLRSLDSQLERIGQPQQSPAAKNLEVRVMFARSNGLYPVIVHLFVLGRGITVNDLGGELLRGQWTFKVKSLIEFSNFYALSVFEVMGEEYHPLEGIKYHEDPPMPTEDYGRVSYRLVTKLDDTQGEQLLELVRRATYELYLNHNSRTS